MVGGALLTAAATALTVKGTLDGPLGGVAPEALAQSRGALDQATARLVGAVVRVPPASPRGAPSSGPAAAAPASAKATHEADARPDPETRGRGTYSRLLLRRILREAALRHQLDPKLVLGLSYWESGWDQSRVSETGAVGLMQVQPATAEEAGPALLGRTVDINDPYDNADVGAAILRENLDTFKSPEMALAAYYQGPTSLRQNGMFPDTQQYVQGILALAARMSP